jgi:uncharacterized protein
MVNLEIMTFIERCVLPRYAAFDSAHNMEHVMSVIKRSIVLAEKQGVDVDMAYVIAAYHDLGLEGPRAIHHLTSGKILKADKRLEKWFSPQQIEIMKEAVEDHRASSSHVPRNIYGKIVAEADRDLRPETVIRRTIQFGLSHYPEMSKEEHWKRFVEHIEHKYSVNGYIKLWIRESDNERYLSELRNIASDKVKLRSVFEKLFLEETTR